MKRVINRLSGQEYVLKITVNVDSINPSASLLDVAAATYIKHPPL